MLLKLCTKTLSKAYVKPIHSSLHIHTFIALKDIHSSRTTKNASHFWIKFKLVYIADQCSLFVSVLHQKDISF